MHPSSRQKALQFRHKCCASKEHSCHSHGRCLQYSWFSEEALPMWTRWSNYSRACRVKGALKFCNFDTKTRSLQIRSVRSVIPRGRHDRWPRLYSIASDSVFRQKDIASRATNACRATAATYSSCAVVQSSTQSPSITVVTGLDYHGVKACTTCCCSTLDYELGWSGEKWTS